MSDFLLNLARRSAGRAPVVRARVLPFAWTEAEPQPVAAETPPAVPERLEARLESSTPRASIDPAPTVHRELIVQAPRAREAARGESPVVASAPPAIQRVPVAAPTRTQPAAALPPTIAPAPRPAGSPDAVTPQLTPRAEAPSVDVPAIAVRL
ncbi:MAG: hypothetical protein ACXWA9_07230, partial [Acidimicrobiia bacterium]